VELPALSPEATKGDTYVAALGRFDDLPAPIAKLANEAVRKYGPSGVDIKPIFDDDGLFVGYRVEILTSKGPKKFHVTGASRFIDNSPPEVKEAADRDAPPESDTFAGGYGASAEQGARYAAYRRSQGM
jgi:hypothetical protein